MSVSDNSRYSESNHSKSQCYSNHDVSQEPDSPGSGNDSEEPENHLCTFKQQKNKRIVNRESSANSYISQMTRHSTVRSTKSRRHEIPTFPRRTDFGEHYPDGGWGRIICGGAFIVHFLVLGFHLASGSLYFISRSRFETSHQTSVWLECWSFSSCYLISPLIFAICRRKSVRLFAMIGGLVCSLGCLFMSFSTHVHQLLISSSVVLGFGSGITLSTANIMVGRYFYRRREVAEMLVLSGSGVGMSVITVFIKQGINTETWMRSLQILAGLLLPTVGAAACYRSPSIYHPRRKAILHIKNIRKTKAAQREFENKQPYWDFGPLRMRSFQCLLVAVSVISFGGYVPFALINEATERESIDNHSTVLLFVFFGVAFAFGSLLFGLIVIRSSLRCMIARQYLVQFTSFSCGILLLILTMAQGFNAFALFVWVYGIMYGGFCYSLKVYTLELVTIKLAEVSFGYLMGIQAIPILIGAPAVSYLNIGASSGPEPGFVLAGLTMVLGSSLLFFMPWAKRHKSNYQIIQAAHLRAKICEHDMLFRGMEISSDQSANGRLLNNINGDINNHKERHSCYQNGGIESLSKKHPCGLLLEENRWSDIEAMTPMSGTDKVTDFLLHSQSMLQSYSQIKQLEIPNVKLEINKVEAEDSGSGSRDTNIQEEILQDIKLLATIRRHSHRRNKSTTSFKSNKSLNKDDDGQVFALNADGITPSASVCENCGVSHGSAYDNEVLSENGVTGSVTGSDSICEHCGNTHYEASSAADLSPIMNCSSHPSNQEIATVEKMTSL